MAKYKIELETENEISGDDVVWLIAKNVPHVTFIGIREIDSNEER